MVSELHNQSYSESINVRFDGNNYAYWAYSFRTFIKSKGLLGYLDGSCPLPTASSVREVTPKPTDSESELGKSATSVPSSSANLDELIASWEMADARVLSYIISSVDSSIALSLRSFPASAAVWSHLQATYSHVSASRLFDLEFALANLSQGELDVNHYYLAADNLWTEIDLLSTSMLSTAANLEIQAERRRARSFQFLMRLRPEFEQARSQLISSNKTEMSEIISELIRAETRLRTEAQLDNSSIPATPGTVFAAGKSRPQFFSSNSKSYNIGNGHNPSSLTLSKSSSEIRCHHCQELGHYISQCRKRNICTYCKKSGHLIPDCRLRIRNNARTGHGSSGSGYMVNESAASSSSTSDVGSVSSSNFPNEGSLDSMVQAALTRVLPQALNSAFASVGISVLDVYKFNLPSLNRANIKLLGNWHVWFDSSDYDARKQMLIEWCDNLFKILHNVQALDLQVETFELLIQICGSMKHQAPHFKRMKFLNLKCRGGSRNVPYQVIHYFLGGSPNEEDKRFTVENLC